MAASIGSPACADGEDAAAELGRLERALAGADRRGPAPVERWNPPYCGDIGMAIAADGTWSYRGSPIRRPALVALFASVLKREADGRHYLVTPVEKVDVVVADAPFMAVELEAVGKGDGRALVVRTNLDDVVRICAEHPLRFAIEAASGGVKPYILVRGRLEALATRALTHELLALAEPDPSDGVGHGEGHGDSYGIRSAGAWFPLPLEGGGIT